MLRKCGPYIEWRIQLNNIQITCRRSECAIEHNDLIDTSFVVLKVIVLKRVHDILDLQQAQGVYIFTNFAQCE